jgi:hypothetical protein
VLHHRGTCGSHASDVAFGLLSIDWQHLGNCRSECKPCVRSDQQTPSPACVTRALSVLLCVDLVGLGVGRPSVPVLGVGPVLRVRAASTAPAFVLTNSIVALSPPPTCGAMDTAFPVGGPVPCAPGGCSSDDVRLIILGDTSFTVFVPPSVAGPVCPGTSPGARAAAPPGLKGLGVPRAGLVAPVASAECRRVPPVKTLTGVASAE